MLTTVQIANMAALFGPNDPTVEPHALRRAAAAAEYAGIAHQAATTGLTLTRWNEVIAAYTADND